MRHGKQDEDTESREEKGDGLGPFMRNAQNPDGAREPENESAKRSAEIRIDEEYLKLAPDGVVVEADDENEDHQCPEILLPHYMPEYFSHFLGAGGGWFWKPGGFFVRCAVDVLSDVGGVIPEQEQFERQDE